MGRKGLLLCLAALLAVACLLVSCDPEIPMVPGYRTPTVKGSITVPAASGLFTEDIWLKVVDGTETRYVGKVGADGKFEVGGLEEGKLYSILFSSSEPDHGNVTRDAIPRASGTDSSGYGGWLTDVTAAIDEGNDLGSVKIKPLGTINGKAIRGGAVDNYDVMVYIPGTSFMAMTNEDGSFSIANVPQGTHRLRYTSDDYMSQMKEKVLLFLTMTR